MTITVIITDWCVPFDQVVREIRTFKGEKANGKALAFINAASLAWWQAHEGDRCLREMRDTEPYQPIAELGYNHAQYMLWGGEVGFCAMLDHASYARLNDAHYKGKPLPGYLQVAKLTGHWPK